MIKKGTINDIDEILKVEETSYNESLSKDELLYELKENPVSEFFIFLDENNKIIAYIDFWITFDSSTIFKITVDESYRNKGIGTKLFERLFDYLKEKDVLYLTLEVRKDNLSAISLYHKVGFSDITIKPHYYKDGCDAIYMVKGIN